MSPAPTTTSKQNTTQMLVLAPSEFAAGALPLPFSLPAPVAPAAPVQPPAHASTGRVVTSVRQLLRAMGTAAKAPTATTTLPFGSQPASQMQVAVAPGMLPLMPVLPHQPALPSFLPPGQAISTATPRAAFSLHRQHGYKASLHRTQHAKHTTKPAPSSRKRSPSPTAPTAPTSHGRKGSAPRRAAME